MIMSLRGERKLDEAIPYNHLGGDIIPLWDCFGLRPRNDIWYCHLREDERSFRLDRIVDVRVDI